MSMSPKLPISAALSILTAFGGGFTLQSKPEKEKRPCLQCGKLKQHNNSFCSAECCRAHKLKSRDKNE